MEFEDQEMNEYWHRRLVFLSPESESKSEGEWEPPETVGTPNYGIVQVRGQWGIRGAGSLVDARTRNAPHAVQLGPVPPVTLPTLVRCCVVQMPSVILPVPAPRHFVQMPSVHPVVHSAPVFREEPIDVSAARARLSNAEKSTQSALFIANYGYQSRFFLLTLLDSSVQITEDFLSNPQSIEEMVKWYLNKAKEDHKRFADCSHQDTTLLAVLSRPHPLLGGEIDNESTMRPLTEVFRESQRLRNLCLFFNNPEERAMKVLCESLKHPQCTIEMLKLDGEIAKESTMRPLTEVLRENQRLRKLHFSFFYPDERPMEILCEGLKHPQCTIETLELDGEIAKESTMRPLIEVLRENQRLRNLHFSFYYPDERAMEILCEGLKDPQCTIEKLQFGGEIDNESTMRHLKEVFRENQRLRNLCLSFNCPDEEAIEILCEGLKHPQCTIEMLEFSGEIDNGSTMRPLIEVLKENQRLRNLSLSFKNPDERAMEVLCEGLKHPHCTVEMLKLDGEIAKESTMRPLREVFRENQRLRNLCLSFNYPDERAMKIMCEGLKYPQCIIEMLKLGGEIDNESTMRPLTEVLRENQRLRNLCLSFKNTDERAMEVLCEGLKYPQCTIEMLELDGEIAFGWVLTYLAGGSFHLVPRGNAGSVTKIPGEKAEKKMVTI
ncbi:ribonuclease inhibitor-like [Erythrolamprus reginae]|uniref:ribonuclease inhibitor-like n=1 Tax=Erythrolamprus reginae TaxID=121349 RepID=UPI00396CE0EE